MSIILGVGIAATATTVTLFYMGKKGWQALHKAVGITPGVLTYQDPQAPILLMDITWQQLSLNRQHLSCLPDSQLRQLQRIDRKVGAYHSYQQELKSQNKTPALTEQQFVLHKLLQLRLPEMLASHYHLARANNKNCFNDTGNLEANNDKRVEAGQLLQQALNNIEQRLESLLEQMETQHLLDLRVMKSYIESHNS